MNYVRSPTLYQSLSLDGQRLDQNVLLLDRQNLIDQFNAAIGAPGQVVQEMQQDFVRGKMPYDEMVSYVRFCEYMIHAIKERANNSSK